ncbi:unnamed protein product [Bursaphelenchus okinawaensis]|uniref:Uncharacterized protein n=1 Tax=Bursaphelenchus okinawaensis TaxID=465554 RepID=A0A811KBC6_9BILA|nr:unnamed protein product [Bursaphelenchus okinawaensis]CAG9100853.1 unnamed protein product [Bursaphelenchus okinawaensis]
MDNIKFKQSKNESILSGLSCSDSDSTDSEETAGISALCFVDVALSFCSVHRAQAGWVQLFGRCLEAKPNLIMAVI